MKRFMSLELHNISKVYDKKVLDNINLTLKNGVYALFGLNGVGK